MALPGTIDDREYQKFEENASDGGTDVRVTLKSPIEVETNPGGNILSGIEYDEVQASYPTATTEKYEYYEASSLVATVDITYTDSTKRFITSVIRT